MVISNILYLLVGLIIGVGSIMGWNYVNTDSHAGNIPTHTVSSNKEPSIERSVHLTEKKLEVAKIELGEVVERTMKVSRTVPGRLRYDERWHIEVKVPTAGIVTEVRVKPGEFVRQGQVLAVTNSPEVGSSRAKVLKYLAQLELDRRDYAWKKGTCEGVEKLITAIKSKRSPQLVTDDMKSVSLGAFRASILEAYSRYRLAQSLADKLVPLAHSGAIPGLTIKKRISEKESSQAALESAIEQAAYVANKECGEAHLVVEDAKRRLQVSQQYLNTLLGYVDSSVESRKNEGMSSVEVRAAFDGTIESQMFSVSDRVEPNAALFVLANTSSLWVAASIREREWNALKLVEGQKLRVTSPAFPGQLFTAKVYYIGREVNSETNAVSLISSIENKSGLLRPGQFVQVDLPLEIPRQVFAVPEASIVEHKSHSFVFVASDGGEYRRVDVRQGIRDNGWVEIVSGVRPGDRVVTQGAFYLKSELLLKSENF